MVPRQQHNPPPQVPPHHSPPFRPDLFRQSSANSKRSFPSSYSADDERSIAADTMGPDRERDVPARPPQYDGEDTSLTSRRELWGFYIYGWAAEVNKIAWAPVESMRADQSTGVCCLRCWYVPCRYCPPAQLRCTSRSTW